MPAKRELTMRQLRHMLRLAHDGVSAREMGRRLGVARSTIQDNLKRVSLSEIKSEHIDDAIHRELASNEWLRRIVWRVISASPCATRGVFERYCNNPSKSATLGANDARQRRQRDQGIPVGSSRSSVRNVRFAKATRGAVGLSRMPIARKRRLKTSP